MRMIDSSCGYSMITDKGSFSFTKHSEKHPFEGLLCARRGRIFSFTKHSETKDHFHSQNTLKSIHLKAFCVLDRGLFIHTTQLLTRLIPNERFPSRSLPHAHMLFDHLPLENTLMITDKGSLKIKVFRQNRPRSLRESQCSQYALSQCSRVD